MTKSIGWLEMSVQVPDDWDLVAESGGISEAYMRFDSVDRVRMEIKWERTKKRGEAMPVLAIDGYIKEATKSVKDKKSVSVIEKGNARVAGHKASYSMWKIKDEFFITTCWLCQDEGKIVLAQYFLAPGESKSDQFEEVLRGIECHTEGDFYNYRLFGVKFQVPKGFQPSTRKILVGRVRTSFVRMDSILYLSWVAMAREQLRKHKTIGRFFNSSEASNVKSIGGIGALAKKVKDDDEAIDLSSVVNPKIPFLSKPKHSRLKVIFDENFNKLFITGYACKPDDVEKAEAFMSSVGGCE